MDGELVLQRLNDSENGALGFLAGAIEAVATQPLTYWKNAAQQGLGFTLNPRLLYRGTTVSAINDGTLTAFQFAASGWFQKLFAGGVVRELSPAETLASTLAEYNEAARTGVDPIGGKKFFTNAPFEMDEGCLLGCMQCLHAVHAMHCMHRMHVYM